MKKVMFSLLIGFIGNSFVLAADSNKEPVNTELQQTEKKQRHHLKEKWHKFMTERKNQETKKEFRGRKFNPELKEYFTKYPDVLEDLKHNQKLWQDLPVEERAEQCRLWQLRNPEAAALMKARPANQECQPFGRKTERFKAKKAREARMKGECKKSGKCEMKSECKKSDECEVNGECKNSGKCEMNGECKKSGKCEVNGECKKSGKCEVKGESKRHGKCEMKGKHKQNGFKKAHKRKFSQPSDTE